MSTEDKKLNSETLGEYLKAVREQHGFSLKQVAIELGIAPRYIEALEKSAFDMLPADVYVAGFLHSMARLYDLPAAELLAEFKKEKSNIKQSELRVSVKEKKAAFRIELTPKMLSLLAAGGILFALIGFVIWQVARLNQPPALEISEPKEGQKITQTYVLVSGKTDPGMRLTINDEQVLVDDKGIFSASLGISPGQKQLIIRSQNKFDRTTTRIVNVIGELPQTSQPAVNFTVDIIALGQIKVETVADGLREESVSLEPGQTKKITAETTILLSTNDAGNTQVLINGKNLGVLGKPGEILRLIPFTASTTDLVNTKSVNSASQEAAVNTTGTPGTNQIDLTPQEE